LRGRGLPLTVAHAAVYYLAFVPQMRYVGRPMGVLMAMLTACPSGNRHHSWPPCIVFGDAAMTGLRYGQPAPDFTLPSTSGADVALSALRGQDVVLVFYCFDWGSI
jgi:hypothetical protein